MRSARRWQGASRRLILSFVLVVNMSLHAWEKALMARRGLR